MYTSQNLVTRIKSRAKEQGILIRDMLTACGLNINTISQISDKRGLSSFALARIADYLDCSVDYLLGRDSSGDSISVSASNISGGSVVQGKHTGDFVLNAPSTPAEPAPPTPPAPSTPANQPKYSEETAEILRILDTIGLKGRTELLSFAFNLEEKYKAAQ